MEMTTEFTPFASSIGGAMIGASAVLLMATHGRIAGISGIAVRLFPPYLDKDAAGRLMFIIGLIAAPLLYATLTGGWAPMTIAASSGLPWSKWNFARRSDAMNAKSDSA